ncbi:Flp family type IVb pilin [Mesorhizobium sp. M0217]|uniref:Flp family type IVb pilin n=1 Tax=unclassified Mesorhizobium TaxID=325217 RepID=UPI0033388B5B
MSNLIARFAKDESGATAIEYGLIAALIALAIMVGAGQLGNALNAKFTAIADCVEDPSNPAACK